MNDKERIYTTVLNNWINMENIQIFPRCIKDIIIEYVKELYNYEIIEMYENDWERISKHEYLPEEFIEKYEDNVHWYYISCYQKLSKEFIEKYKDNVKWICI